jgi:hypothetical protein
MVKNIVHPYSNSGSYNIPCVIYLVVFNMREFGIGEFGLTMAASMEGRDITLPCSSGGSPCEKHCLEMDAASNQFSKRSATIFDEEINEL